MRWSGISASALLYACAQAWAADCVTCHPAEAHLHLATAHASALKPALVSEFAGHLPSHPLAESADGYKFTYRRTPTGLLATAERGADAAQGLITWVFGSGARGQTPFIVSGNRFMEHRVSLYRETGYGITTGQDGAVSKDAQHALGLWQSPDNVQSCFGCHTTGFTTYNAAFTPGVQCARCHAGAAEHANGQGAPVNPGKLDAPAQVKLCAECHRLTPPDNDQTNIANVRFQPLRLIKSKCYLAGGAKCTTCHPAHRDALRNNPAFYNAKCQGCHGALAAHVATQRSPDCVACHMPRSRPHPALEFTDHFIRVVTIMNSK